MIAIDTSALIAFFHDEPGAVTDGVDRALEAQQAVLPPVVLTEMLSDPKLDRSVARLLRRLPVLEIHDGFWQRAAETRARILARRLRARLADTLIAQSCIDHRLPLISRDQDFRHFARFAGLSLLL